jgi:aspartate/methionine/tyrosine aminotransferase
LATLSSGDEVVIPSPYWASYLDQVQLTDGTSVLVSCALNSELPWPEGDGFRGKLGGNPLA